MNPYEENGYDPSESGQQKQPEQTPFQAAGSSDVDNGVNAPSHNSAQQAAPGWQPESPYANSPYMNAHQQGSYQYAQAAPKPRKPRKQQGVWGKRVVAGVLCASLVAAGCGITAWGLSHRMNMLSADNQQLQQQLDAMQRQLDAVGGISAAGSPVSADGSLTPGQVYAQNVSSVVSITSAMQANAFGQTAVGSGSGFILTQDGYVLTNHHVIEGADAIRVTTADGVEYDAQLIGSDAGNDVAVLKVDGENLPAVTIGTSSDLIIGDMVVAIGNPLGTLAATQTVGYVCGKDRDVSTGGAPINMLQTDAAINPGNSGGPLFNMKGEVIGITTAKYSGTTGSGASIEGIGFAIPIDDVMDIVADLMEYGYVTGAYLGVTVTNMDPEEAAMYGIPVGAYIREVVEGGSADRAGLQPKDIVTRIGEYDVGSITDLSRALRHYDAGDTTTVTFVRSGVESTVDITLDEKPQNLNQPPVEDPNNPMPSEGDYDEWFEFFNRFFGDQFGN